MNNTITPEETLSKTPRINRMCGPSRNLILKAMKEYAKQMSEQAWDACDDVHQQESGQRTLASEKQTWINTKFPDNK